MLADADHSLVWVNLITSKTTTAVGGATNARPTTIHRTVELRLTLTLRHPVIFEVNSNL